MPFASKKDCLTAKGRLKKCCSYKEGKLFRKANCNIRTGKPLNGATGKAGTTPKRKPGNKGKSCTRWGRANGRKVCRKFG